jgi:hypothetical protein
MNHMNLKHTHVNNINIEFDDDDNDNNNNIIEVVWTTEFLCLEIDHNLN